jgi:hypothetical protein
MSPVEQELPIFHEHLLSVLIFSGVLCCTVTFCQPIFLCNLALVSIAVRFKTSEYPFHTFQVFLKVTLLKARPILIHMSSLQIVCGRSLQYRK